MRSPVTPRNLWITFICILIGLLLCFTYLQIRPQNQIRFPQMKVKEPLEENKGTFKRNDTSRCGDGILHDYDCLDTYDFRERVFAEKRFIPPPVMEELPKIAEDQKKKRIVLVGDLHGYVDKVGIDKYGFMSKGCLISQCDFSKDLSKKSLESADAVLFRIDARPPAVKPAQFKRPKDQIWATILIESPFHSYHMAPFRDMVNFTATYRTSSSFFFPFGMYRPYTNKPQTANKAINYATGRKKKVAWMASNCERAYVQNERMKYVKELAKYIQVDTFGGCGTIKCPRESNSECINNIGRDYKFYLAFENSNCRDFITEKFFNTSLRHNLLPVVMGGHPDDYKKMAPPHSYIHVDEFDSPKDLAEYLNKLDKDDKLYNEYFKWHGMGEVIDNENMDFYCRFCAVLWADRPRMWITDIKAWWRGKDICIGPGKWPNITKDDPNNSYRHSIP